MEAREITAAPSWKKSGDGLLVHATVGPAVDARDISDTFDLDMETLGSDGDFRRVRGGEMVERLLGRHIKFSQGSSPLFELVGTWLREWLNQIELPTADTLEHLLRVEIARISHLPVTQTDGIKAPVLWGVEYVREVTVLDFQAEETQYTFRARVGLELRGVGSQSFVSDYTINKEAAQRPVSPFLAMRQNRDELLNQISGYWCKPGVPMDPKPKGPPNGALILARDAGDSPLALVLHQVGSQWRGLSYRSASSLPFAAALQKGEKWTFGEYSFDERLARAWAVGDVEGIGADDVERMFGSEAKARAPSDRASLALRLHLLSADKTQRR